jgi:hypothetical protein
MSLMYLRFLHVCFPLVPNPKCDEVRNHGLEFARLQVSVRDLYPSLNNQQKWRTCILRSCSYLCHVDQPSRMCASCRVKRPGCKQLLDLEVLAVAHPWIN